MCGFNSTVIQAIYDDRRKTYERLRHQALTLLSINKGFHQFVQLLEIGKLLKISNLNLLYSLPSLLILRNVLRSMTSPKVMILPFDYIGYRRLSEILI